MKEKEVTVTLRLTPYMSELITKEAKKSGISLNEYINKILENNN